MFIQLINFAFFSFRRLFIRGIDDEGRVANFVETEQILQLNDVACSYVQVIQRETKNRIEILSIHFG